MNSLRLQTHDEPVNSREMNVRACATVDGIGTFVLVATAGIAVFSPYPLASLGLGVVLMVMIHAAGQLAGGHFDAAVTLAVLMRRRVGLRAAAGHWLAQIGGGLLATTLVRLVVDPDHLAARIEMLTTKPVIPAAFLAELIFTFVLSYAVLGLATTDAPSPTSTYDLAVGVAAIVGALGVAALAAGAFTAAGTFRHMTTDLFTLSTVWAYMVGQIVAGLFAGLAFLTCGWWAHVED